MPTAVGETTRFLRKRKRGKAGRPTGGPLRRETGSQATVPIDEHIRQPPLNESVVYAAGLAPGCESLMRWQQAP